MLIFISFLFHRDFKRVIFFFFFNRRNEKNQSHLIEFNRMKEINFIRRRHFENGQSIALKLELEYLPRRSIFCNLSSFFKINSEFVSYRSLSSQNISNYVRSMFRLSKHVANFRLLFLTILFHVLFRVLTET